MFCGRNSNNRINNLHERASRARVVDNDINHLFNIYLRKTAQCLYIHHGNTCLLAIETNKVKNYTSTPTMYELFEKCNLNYNLRPETDFPLHSPSTLTYGLKSLKYFAEKVWNIVPFEIRNAVSLEELKVRNPRNVPVGCV